MARRRLRLSYIVNLAKRKASYQKRKTGMFKKLNELTILCGADAAIIMYSSFETGPVVWPSIEKFQQMIVRFMNMPDVQQTRGMMSQERFVTERIEKLCAKLLKVKKDNREREMNALMHKIFAGEQTIDSLSFIELNDLGWILNMNLFEIYKRVEAIMRDSPTSTSSALAPTTTLAPFLPGAPSLATTSPLVLGPRTSNVGAPTDVFSRQSYQGTMGIETPMSPNLNP